MLSGDNGILQRATDAKQNSERAEAKEQAQMDIMAYIADKTANHQDASLDDTKVKGILTGKSYVKTANDTNFTTAKGEYVIPYSELYTANDLINDTPLMTTLPEGTYTQGQIVTVEGEDFFVLEDQGNTVKLLAKYCLNREGTAQVNEGSSTYGRGFSKTSYWTMDLSDAFDLQSSSMIANALQDGEVSEGIPNAVIAAQNYGTAKGVIKGRLMTKEEANILDSAGSKMKKILLGNWKFYDNLGDIPVDGSLCFWLGDAFSVYYINSVSLEYGVSYSGYDAPAPGIRPVLIISKS